MIRTDKEQIIHSAGIIADWSPEGTVVELEHTFLILNDIPQDKYLEQWDLVRKAFKKNKDLHDELLHETVRREDFSTMGYWW